MGLWLGEVERQSQACASMRHEAEEKYGADGAKN